MKNKNLYLDAKSPSSNNNLRKVQQAELKPT